MLLTPQQQPGSNGPGRRGGAAGIPRPAWAPQDMEDRARRFPWRIVLLVVAGLFLLSLVRQTFLLVQPEIRSLTRIAIAEYPAAKVFSSERHAIQSEIEQRLREKLARNYIVVDEVLLRDVRFSDAFQNAIIAQQIAQQNAQRMKYVLEKEQMSKQRKIILAEGEAQAIRLKGRAIAANGRVVRYEYVQKIAPNIQGIITDGKSVPVPGVDQGAAR